MFGLRRHDEAAGRAAGQRGNRDMASYGSRSLGEIIGLVKRADLGFIGEQNVDMTVDQVAERRAMPSDAERVGKAERQLAARGMGYGRRLAKCFLRVRRVEEIAFEISNPGGSDDLGVDVGGSEIDAGAEIGVHCLLTVGGDEDQAARRAWPCGGRCGIETHADRGEVVAEYLPQKVVAYLA